jgi:predicted acylesterase/phospholipase RssA
MDQPAAAGYSGATQECDLIMKGGITSGVVYPRAACHLAQTYRFGLLGGASAGAIAAVFVAAAEHGRDTGGFERLAEIPDELGTRLHRLFQPSPGLEAPFGVVLAGVEPGWGPAKKGLVAIGRVVRAHLLAFLIGVVATALVFAPVAWSAASGGRWGALWVLPPGLPIALAVGVLAAGYRLARTALRCLPANGFGLCDGHTRSDDDQVPFTDWMADSIDHVAGRPTTGPPLTFGDLWGEEAVRLAATLDDRSSAADRREAKDARLVDLEVMTTNLTFRRPYRFPFSDNTFFFCEKRWRGYFPERVVDHMVARSQAVPDRSATGPSGPHTISTRCGCHDEPVRYLPRPPDLPVVVAARLSLSFPLLISAVPLHCVDWSRAPGQQELIETWVSDGGISSNFPVHLFDSLWPRRPTFAINLQPPHPDFPRQMVWRARAGASGIVPRSHPIDSVFGFAAAIADTMQNWVDATQITLPGYRDRVAELRHTKEEGGMNLKMAPGTIEALANRGGDAAALLDDFSFDVHRWIRYRSSMSELDDLLAAVRERYGSGAADGFEAFLHSYSSQPDCHPFQNLAQATHDLQATRAMIDLAEAWARDGHPAQGGSVPRPKPTLRMVPRQ